MFTILGTSRNREILESLHRHLKKFKCKISNLGRLFIHEYNVVLQSYLDMQKSVTGDQTILNNSFDHHTIAKPTVSEKKKQWSVVAIRMKILKCQKHHA